MHFKVVHGYYRTLIGSRTLEVEPSGQRGRVATRSDQNVIEAEQLITS